MNSRTKSTLDLAIKLLLLVYLGINSFTFRFYAIPITKDLDVSWMFGVNYFWDKGFKFGKDIVWTYGPLGFLEVPMNVGNCTGIAFVFQLSVWIAFLSIVAYYSLKNRFSAFQLFLFAVLFYMGPYPSTLLFMLAFLLISLAFVNTRWIYPYILAVVCSVLLFFIKLSYPALMLPAFAVFILSQFFINKKKALYSAVIAAVGFPLLFTAFYLIYNPSFSDMLAFLKGSQELSSGYSVAMSHPETNSVLIAAGSMLLFYLYFMYVLYRKRQTSFWISLLLIVPLFWTFKSGFVRQNSPHSAVFFTGVLFFVGLTLLFTDLKSTGMKVRALIFCALALVVWYDVYQVGPFAVTTHYLNNIKRALNYSESKESRFPQEGRIELRLPSAALEAVGSSKVGIFPWEISYAAVYDLNYSPFPVPQLYSAYTPYLDSLNARYLEHSPDFMLMEWLAIDGRHPLLDTPATWLNMYKWFDVYGRNDDLLLLKRRDKPRFKDIRTLSSGEYPTDSLIQIPALDNPILIKISMRLDLLGRLAKLFFRVPQVRMELYTNRDFSAYRVVPDTLNSPTIINAVPLNLKDVSDLMSNEISRRVVAIKLYGEGLKYYQKEINVVFYQVPVVKINFDDTPSGPR